MDVRPGYRWTEIGEIPTDWEVSTVGKEFSIQLGKMLDSEKNLGILKPYIGNRAVQWGRIQVNDVGSIKLSPSDLQRFRLRRGDLLVCEGGEIGRAAIWNEQLTECYYQKALHRLRPKRGYDVSLMLYELERLSSIGYLINFVTKTSIAHLPKDKFETVPIPVPPTTDEQEAIAEALSDANALIESLEQLIAKKRHVKQGAMHELLRPKEGWVSKRLDELAEIRSGGTPSTTRSEFWDGDVLWCTPTDITSLTGHKFLKRTSRTITAEGLKCSSAELLPSNSIVMTSRATIGECAINQVPVSTNQGFKNFIPFEGVDVEFLYYLLLTKKQDFISLCGGSTFPEIGKTQIVSFEVEVPLEGKEQTAIASIISAMDAEIDALEAKLVKARQLKRGMMQDLLTGKIRLLHPLTSHKSSSSQEKEVRKSERPHNWAFNEAVIVAALADQFGSEGFPLGRKRYTKLSYLLHRKTDQEVEGYLKKAAGPYNPRTKYAGPERIASEKKYIRQHQKNDFNGFVAAENVQEAKDYFAKWYGTEIIEWLEQFRYRSNDELERLATVDVVVQEVLDQGSVVDVESVRSLIESEPEWLSKLSREIFSDTGIALAIEECRTLFQRRPENSE